ENAGPVTAVTLSAHRGQSFVELIGRLAPRARSLRAALVVDELGAVTDELGWDRERVDAEPLASEIGVILYTSGTTGEPKGALVQHARETGAAGTLRRILEVGPDDRSAQAIPIAHAFGLTCMLTALSAGACVVLADSAFSPRELLAALRGGGATLLRGSPA